MMIGGGLWGGRRRVGTDKTDRQRLVWRANCQTAAVGDDYFFTTCFLQQQKNDKKPSPFTCLLTMIGVLCR